MPQTTIDDTIMGPSLEEVVGLSGANLAPALAFWKAIQAIIRARFDINHSGNPNRRAYHYPQIRQLAHEIGCPLPLKREMYQSLRYDRRFVGEQVIHSRLTRRPVRCWVFLHHVDGARRRG